MGKPTVDERQLSLLRRLVADIQGDGIPFDDLRDSEAVCAYQCRVKDRAGQVMFLIDEIEIMQEQDDG